MIARAVLMVAVAAVCVPAWADIYVYSDERGVLRLTDQADHPRYLLVLREQAKAARLPKAVPGAVVRPLKLRPFHAEIEHAAGEFGLEPALVHAVIGSESAYDPKAISPKGALGLMQIMPATAERYGVLPGELVSPRVNIRTGTRHLAGLLQLFGGDLVLALAAYNAGEHAVIRQGMRVPPYPETQLYVPRVLQTYRALRGGG